MGIKCIPGLATHVDTIEKIEGIIASWKMSTDDAKQLRWTFNNLHDYKLIKNLQAMIVNGTPREWVVDLLEAQKRPYDRMIIREWEIPVFPVSGQDLIDEGYTPGKRLGDTLKAMRSYWVNENYKPTKKDLIDASDMFDGSYD